AILIPGAWRSTHSAAPLPTGFQVPTRQASRSGGSAACVLAPSASASAAGARELASLVIGSSLVGGPRPQVVATGPATGRRPAGAPIPFSRTYAGRGRFVPALRRSMHRSHRRGSVSASDQLHPAVAGAALLAVVAGQRPVRA